MNDPTPSALATDRLIEIMARLRAPDGCAWDREQTPATLKPQLLEEVYEVLEAIDSGKSEHLTEELGDLLLHVVFQAQLAREAGDFDFAAVANGICDKLIRRHPHVFGDVKANDSAAIVTQWDEIKKTEKPERESVLDGVPRALPALMRAEALQKKARNVGFDWPDPRGSIDKVREEIAELTREVEEDITFSQANEARIAGGAKTAEELGDLLFSIVNLSRHLRLDAEALLTAANDKFSTRFKGVETIIKAKGKAMKDCTLDELDAAWNEVKASAAIESSLDSLSK